MNSRTGIIALVGLTLVQLAAIVVTGRTKSPARVESFTDSAAAAPAAPKNTSATSLAPSLAMRSSTFRWTSLESTNYVEFIANLRAFGVPEGTVRDILLAELNKLYTPLEAPLRAALDDKLVRQPDAVARRAAMLARAEHQRRLRDLQREKNALIRTLLGATAPQDGPGVHAAEATRFRSAFNALPPEKRDAVREIQEAYWQGADALQSGSAPRGPEYNAALQRLKAERAAQLARTLAPAQLEEFEMRTLPVGIELTELLGDFPAAEDEYRRIFRIQKELDEPDITGTRPTVAQREKRAEEQIKTVLGEARYAEYARAQDPTFQELARLGARYGLSQESVTRGFEAVQRFHEQQMQVEENEALDPAQAQQSIKTLRGQLDKVLNGIFGEKPARAFRRESGLFLDVDGE